MATIERYRVADFPWILVNTGDRDHPARREGYRVFSYSTTSGDYTHACPDFIFDHWKQTQLDDYETTCAELSVAGAKPPATDLLGWRGAATHPARAVLVTYDDKQEFDVELIKWDRSRPERLNCSNFVSLDEQVRRWRYLIDIEGFGYSARLKLLFFSQRVVFLQQRPYEEWYFPEMRPWVHYVPVNRDLSDLEQNLNLLRRDPLLEASISAQALEFARSKLTRAAALQRWAELLGACHGH